MVKPFKKQLFTYFAEVAKALSNGNRLEILEFLAQKACTVEDLASLAGLSIANTSHHLQQLKQMGLVECEKQGLYVRYRLSGNDVIGLIAQLRTVAETHLAKINQLVEDALSVKDNLEAVPANDLLERVQQALVTVLDVRPEEEYLAGHLPGAINIPLSQLESRFKDLDKTREIVAYCRGPHCVLAYDAVSKLRAKGLKAKRLDGGYPEWKLQGLPTE